MKKYLIVIGVILGIAFFTNPKSQDHKELLLNKFKPEMISSFTEGKDVKNLTNADALSLFFGSKIAEGFLDNLVSVDNYLFFSITKITWDNETKAVAIGLFGNLILFKDIDKLKIRV